MFIRKYRPEDCSIMAELFCQTVFAVNTKDYTNEQLHAWTDHLDLENGISLS